MRLQPWQHNKIYTKQKVTRPGLKIAAAQRTMSGQDDHLSGQTFGSPVILTGHVNKRQEKKKIHFQTITFQEDKRIFSHLNLLVSLIRSSYYCVFFQHFDRSEERRDRAKISLAGQHDRHRSQIYFEPCKTKVNTGKDKTTVCIKERQTGKISCEEGNAPIF